jgi:DNA-binding NarL/FixJ family response regulator
MSSAITSVLAAVPLAVADRPSNAASAQPASPSVSAPTNTASTDTLPQDTVELSEAQRVYQLYVQGLQVPQIASLLGLSVAAVNSYLGFSIAA